MSHSVEHYKKHIIIVETSAYNPKSESVRVLAPDGSYKIFRHYLSTNDHDEILHWAKCHIDQKNWDYWRVLDRPIFFPSPSSGSHPKHGDYYEVLTRLQGKERWVIAQCEGTTTSYLDVFYYFTIQEPERYQGLVVWTDSDDGWRQLSAPRLHK